MIFFFQPIVTHSNPKCITLKSPLRVDEKVGLITNKIQNQLTLQYDFFVVILNCVSRWRDKERESLVIIYK